MKWNGGDDIALRSSLSVFLHIVVAVRANYCRRRANEMAAERCSVVTLGLYSS